MIGTPFFQSALFTPSAGITAEGMVSELSRLGISYVLVNLSSGDPDRLPGYLDRSLEIVRLVGVLSERGILREVYRRGDGVVYRFSPVF